MIKANPPNGLSASGNRHLGQLLTRMAGGDLNALDELYQLTRAPVFGLAFSYLQQQQDAEDVTQDTFVILYRSAGRYTEQNKPLAWIFTITKNLALMKLRERQRQAPLSERDESRLTIDHAQRPLEDKLVLQAYLDELKDNEKMIVVLRAVAGWKHREIARFMEMPVQHVIVTYNRAIKKMARKYQESIRRIDEEKKK